MKDYIIKRRILQIMPVSNNLIAIYGNPTSYGGKIERKIVCFAVVDDFIDKRFVLPMVVEQKEVKFADELEHYEALIIR